MPVLREALHGGKEPEASLIPSLSRNVTPLSCMNHFSVPGGDGTGGWLSVPSGFPRETEPVTCVYACVCACVCACLEAYFKKLAHAIVEAGKSKIWRAGR